MSTPLWVSVVGAVSMFGMLVGFCGLFLVMILIAVEVWPQGWPAIGAGTLLTVF